MDHHRHVNMTEHQDYTRASDSATYCTNKQANKVYSTLGCSPPYRGLDRVPISPAKPAAYRNQILPSYPAVPPSRHAQIWRRARRYEVVRECPTFHPPPPGRTYDPNPTVLSLDLRRGRLSRPHPHWSPLSQALSAETRAGSMYSRVHSARRRPRAFSLRSAASAQSCGM